MKRNFALFLAIGIALLMLSSCATVNQHVTSKQPADWVAEQQSRQQIKSWEIRGRLGIQTENDGGTLDIIWKQSGQNFSIRLIAPFGAGNYLAQGDNSRAEIRYPDGQLKVVTNIDDVFSSMLDVNLPISAVKSWIRGLPAKTLSVESLRWNEQGLLNTVNQSGWNVEIKRYTGIKILLPHAIYLSRDDNAELDIRLVLRQWQIND